MASGRPRIDLLDANFYVDGAREAYAWMRRHSPVHLDEQSGYWGIASYDAVRAAEGVRSSSRAAAAPNRSRAAPMDRHGTPKTPLTDREATDIVVERDTDLVRDWIDNTAHVSD